MAQRQRLLLIAPCKMTHSPAFERAAALAEAMDASLSVVAFAYFETMETFNVLDTQGREAARESRFKRFNVLADKYAIDEENRHFIVGAAANVISDNARCVVDKKVRAAKSGLAGVGVS